MSDHFSDRFWSTRFWSTRYFQGGEQNPGSMQASLSGSSSVSAALSYQSDQPPVIVRLPAIPPVRRRRVRKAVPAFMSAQLAGSGSVAPRIAAQGQLRVEIEGVCSLRITATAVKDFSKVDAMFWFMAA